MIADSMQPTRRELLRQISIGLTALSSSYALNQRQIRSDHGRIEPPIDIPAIPLYCADGSSQDLAGLTRAKTTAVQLIFTQCTTTCPIQAAIFQQLQKLLSSSARHGAQLLSISIDPGNDTPQSLREWLHRFHAGNQWTAAVPQPKDLAAIQGLFGKQGNTIENHTTQVHIVNQHSQIVWSSIELPSAESIAAILNRASD
jgi:protein SCO1/2